MSEFPNRPFAAASQITTETVSPVAICQLGGRQMLLEALAEHRAGSRRQYVEHRLVDLDDIEGDLAVLVRLRDDIVAQRQI